jgi:hypothetical protein
MLLKLREHPGMVVCDSRYTPGYGMPFAPFPRHRRGLPLYHPGSDPWKHVESISIIKEVNKIN